MAYPELIKVMVNEFSQVSQLPASVRARWAFWESLVAGKTKAERAQALREAAIAFSSPNHVAQVGVRPHSSYFIIYVPAHAPTPVPRNWSVEGRRILSIVQTAMSSTC